MHGRFPLTIDRATPIDLSGNVHEKRDQRQENTAHGKSRYPRATANAPRLSVSPTEGPGAAPLRLRVHRAHNDATKTKGGAALRANVRGDNLDSRFHPFWVREGVGRRSPFGGELS